MRPTKNYKCDPLLGRDTHIGNSDLLDVNNADTSLDIKFRINNL